jgi:thioredoxin 1
MIFLGLFKPYKREIYTKKDILQDKELPNHVVTIDGKKFDEFIQKYPLSMVDFWAPYCSSCRKMVPRIRRLATIYKGKVAFGKINTLENPDIVKRYKILEIPHLYFFKYGNKIANITGVKSIGDIKDIIDNLLKEIYQ